MPLQQLVEYYNDRFEQEHRSNCRPFLLKAGKVSGLFGSHRIGSVFTPVHCLSNPARILGHSVACTATAHDFQTLQKIALEKLRTPDDGQPADINTIINLDRLTRTVHMLNYLPIVHLDGVLFLEVDPRHILGIKRDHGAYFGEVIEKCGLATHNVVISMTVNNAYEPHHEQLCAGLNNYRRRGYKIALDIGNLYAPKTVRDLITGMVPDYIRVEAPGQEHASCTLSRLLSRLKALPDTAATQTILKINPAEQPFTGSLTGFDWVEGGNFDAFSKQPLPQQVTANAQV